MTPHVGEAMTARLNVALTSPCCSFDVYLVSLEESEAPRHRGAPNPPFCPPKSSLRMLHSAENRRSMPIRADLSSLIPV